MKLFPALLLIICMASGCSDAAEDTAAGRTTGYGDKPQSKEDSLFKDVMHDHDEGMARTRQLSEAIRQMRSKVDSLIKANRNPEAERKILEELESAERSMKTWMEEFNIDTLKDKAERRIEYLENEKVKVSRVKNDILESIRRADSVLTGREQ
jgi:TolA-binding protein